MGTPNKEISGYVTEDSESDFVDVGIMEKWKDKNSDTSANPEICVNGAPIQRPNKLAVNVRRTQTARSSMKKSPLTQLKEQELGKRRISFDLHDAKPQVSIQPSKDEDLRNLFTPSRWSTSSSEPATPRKLIDAENGEGTPIGNQSVPPEEKSKDARIVTKKTSNPPKSTMGKAKVMRLEALRKSRSLKNDASKSRRCSVDLIVKRRNSTGDAAKAQTTALRDSAIDLISDEENSEVYTAVSLAGTLKRSTQPIESGTGMNKKHVIIGVAIGSIVAVSVIIILAVLLAKKQ